MSTVHLTLLNQKWVKMVIFLFYILINKEKYVCVFVRSKFGTVWGGAQTTLRHENIQSQIKSYF